MRQRGHDEERKTFREKINPNSNRKQNHKDQSYQRKNR